MKDFAQIINVGNEKVEACCSFEYKTFTISFTTILNTPNVMIIDKEGNFATETHFYSFVDAIEWVDEHTTLLTDILLKKLSKKQLSALCDMYDNGALEEHILPELIKEDKKNNPAKYVNISDL